ncbi:hypothetical protein Golob_024110 [Gossypium lobatum]|uniref:Uncharacterized protein n=1 Tax=Gossypium lobatum TaxID=34289 RepID=A0A7J8NIT3_9ROSI|nr:hypothetical protein [Gossypium lobatum]
MQQSSVGRSLQNQPTVIAYELAEILVTLHPNVRRLAHQRGPNSHPAHHQHHTITRPSSSTDTVTRPSSSTYDTHGTVFSADARCVS